MKKVYLGGTVHKDTTWREDLIKMLKIEYFNPVVKDWNDEAKQREIHEREICDFVLYVITPLMRGTYSIAEVTDDSNKRPKKTVFCVLHSYDGKSFDENSYYSLKEVGKLIERNGGKFFKSLKSTADYLNSH